MAEVTLKDLSGALRAMAEEQRTKLIPDVHSIKEAVCNDGTLIRQLTSVSDTISEISKKLDLKPKVKPIRNVDGSKKLDLKPKVKPIRNVDGSNKETLKSLNKISSSISELKINDVVKHLDKISTKLDKILDRVKKSGKRNPVSFRESRHDTRRQNKNTKEKESSLEKLGKGIEIIEKIKNIGLKDILLTKTKLKHIFNTIEYIKELKKNKFKGKEAENTMSFVNSSIDMIKNLDSISKIGRTAKKGVSILEVIFIGKKGDGGLLNLFRKLNKGKKDIDSAKARMKDIHNICGSMLLVSMSLSTVAVLGPTAILGSVAFAGISILLTKTFKLLGNSVKYVKNGGKAIKELGIGLLAFSVSMLIMKHAVKDVSFKDVGIMAASIGVTGLAVAGIGKLKSIKKGAKSIAFIGGGLITFSLGLYALKKASTGLSLKDVGVMGASIAGTGLAVAGVGLMSIPIALGSGALILMGASIGLLSLALKPWLKFDSKPAVNNINTAINGLKGTFKGVNEIGATLKGTGTILLATTSLKLLKSGLNTWDKYDSKPAISNIKNAMTELKSMFNEESGDNEKLKNDANDIGQAMRPVRRVLFTMSLIRRHLKKWDKFNGKNAIANIKDALTNLKTMFLDSQLTEDNDDVKDASKDIRNAMRPVRKLLHTMNAIRRALSHWDKVNPKEAVAKIQDTIVTLKEAFGSKAIIKDDDSNLKRGAKGINKAVKPVRKLLHTMIQIKKALTGWDNINPKATVDKIKNVISELKTAFADQNLAKENKDTKRGAKGINKAMKSVQPLLRTMSILQKSLKKWDDYNGTTAVGNIKATIDSLKSNLGNIDFTDMINASNTIKTISINFKEGFGRFNDALNSADALNSDVITKLQANLETWTSSSVKNATNMSNSINLINDAFEKINNRSMTKKVNTMSKLFRTLSKSKIQERYTSTPIKDAVDAVNRMDMSKANLIIGMFKSFASVKTKRPLDDFRSAVDRFVDACKELTDTFNNVSADNVPSTSQEQRSESVQTNVQSSGNTSVSQVSSNVSGGITITNVQELADAISQKMKGAKVVIDPSSLDINIMAEGMYGKSVKLTLQD